MATSLPLMDSGLANGQTTMLQQAPGIHSPGMLSASNGMMSMSMNQYILITHLKLKLMKKMLRKMNILFVTLVANLFPIKMK